ncbi:tRNA 2-thiouridine synthesizing protein E [invertebrate metagenome]|uniref:tRNA 2-thiouridine synthesizing protein E n=1 Tax=invertebrate metagenome TaxID=1711999 RepID=A0A484H6J4_9ZZZZ
MGYVLNGVELEADDEQFLVEPIFDDAIVSVIAAAEDVQLTDDHWIVVRYLRDQYREHGHTPNFRNMVKDFNEDHPGKDWKAYLYELFPKQPARQATRIAGLTKPYGKGGY